MSPGPKTSAVPGRAVIGLLTGRFQLTVAPRCSPVFTVVLVHVWYMNVLLDVTTVGGHNGDLGAGTSRLDPTIVPAPWLLTVFEAFHSTRHNMRWPAATVARGKCQRGTDRRW